MANFRLTNTVPALYAGGPPNRCALCKFEADYPWYLVLEGVYAEESFPSFNGQMVEHTVILCSDHATVLKAELDEIMPDPKLPKVQAALLKAEAARARAEARADKAEAALHALQDWMTEPTSDK